MKTLPGLPHLKPGSVYCIGRNYAEHARELNNPIPDKPVVFMKPVSSLLQDQGTIIIPSYTRDVHHEAELVVAIGKSGKNIPKEEALQYIAGYAIGIDVTARDIQSELKTKAQPWLLAKGLDTFAPLGTFVPAITFPDTSDISISLEINGINRQNGNTKDMLFPVDELIVRLSQYFTLNEGDLIFTGTPEGVGPVRSGDKITASIGQGQSSLTIFVAEG